MTNYNLRRVLNPTLQEPFCPPRPKLPEASVLESSYLNDLTRLTSQQKYTDLIFLCGSVGFSAHRFVMAAASPLLRRILTTGNINVSNSTFKLQKLKITKSSVGKTELNYLRECSFLESN